MDGVKPHCMGTEFPKRDTDSPNVKWTSLDPKCLEFICGVLGVPTAADLDAVAEEQRIKEKTSAKVPNR